MVFNWYSSLHCTTDRASHHNWLKEAVRSLPLLSRKLLNWLGCLPSTSPERDSPTLQDAQVCLLVCFFAFFSQVTDSLCKTCSPNLLTRGVPWLQALPFTGSSHKLMDQLLFLTSINFKH